MAVKQGSFSTLKVLASKRKRGRSMDTAIHNYTHLLLTLLYIIKLKKGKYIWPHKLKVAPSILENKSRIKIAMCKLVSYSFLNDEAPFKSLQLMWKLLERVVFGTCMASHLLEIVSPPSLLKENNCFKATITLNIFGWVIYRVSNRKCLLFLLN